MHFISISWLQQERQEGGWVLWGEGDGGGGTLQANYQGNSEHPNFRSKQISKQILGGFPGAFQMQFRAMEALMMD